MCKAAATIGPGNYFLGDLYLDISAALAGGHTSTADSKITIDQLTKIGPRVTFAGQNKFGKNNQIGADTSFNDAQTGDNVTIGTGCSISGVLQDDVVIGPNSDVGIGVVVGSKAKLVANVVLASYAVVADGITIGTGSCVSYKLQVNKNMPANTMMIANGKIVRMQKGKPVSLLNGICQQN